MADTEKLVLDAASFVAAERLECQIRFDVPFGDLLAFLYEAVDPRREGPMATRVVDREGTQYFPDQGMVFMLWVQAKRDDPDASLTVFEELRLADLNGAHIRGLLGKGKGSTKSPTSSDEPVSAGS